MNMAILRQNSDVVKILLEANTDAEVEMERKRLHYIRGPSDTTVPGRLSTVQQAVDKVSTVDKAWRDLGGSDLDNDEGDAPNKMGVHPIQHAARYGQTEVLELLLEAGGDSAVNCSWGKEAWGAWGAGGETPLMLAARNGHLDSVQLLLDFEADPDLHGFSKHRLLDHSALQQASIEGHTEVVELLMDMVEK